MKTILAAVDFSPVSRNVVKRAIELAHAVQGRVVLVHAVQPPNIISDVPPLVTDAVRFTADVERASRRHLQRVRQQCAKNGLEVEAVCRQGYPTTLILAEAKELDARYIVLGSHGHNAFYDLVVGSTASGVLKRASCPVVVVRAVADKPKRRCK
jgi:universal stress protein A